MSDNLTMHFPDWYLALSEEARAPYKNGSYSYFDVFMSDIEDIKNDTCDTGDTIKLKDVTTKLLALARHLLSFYPVPPAFKRSTHAKEDAATKKGKGKN